MFLEDSSHPGFWWLAGSDLHVPGTLEFTLAGGLWLDLNGSFEASTSRTCGGGDSEHTVIYGHTQSGRPITLLKCSEVSTTKHFGWNEGYDVSTYRVHQAFFGAHAAAQADPLFQSLSLAVPSLLAFIGVSGISSGPSGPDGEHSIRIRNAEEFTFCIGDYVVKTCAGMGTERTPRKLILEERAWLTLSAETPLSLKQFIDGPVRSLHSLVELGADASLPFEALSGTTSEGDDVDILFAQSRATTGVSEVAHSSGLPFTLASLGDKRQDAISRWHAARESYGPTFDLYFSVMRSPTIPVEHKFLFLAQALESFHRRTFQAEACAIAKHETKLIAILDRVPKEHKKWLRGRLRYSHEPTLQERFKALHDSLPDRLKAAIGDGARFADMMSKTRNYLTHFDEKSREGALSSVQELWAANQQLTATIKTLFIRTLNLEADQIFETIWGNGLLQRLAQASKNLRHRYADVQTK